MKLSKILCWGLKAGIACIIAIVGSTGVCMIYDNTPIHYVNETGATDYKWEKSRLYSRWTEGFSYGRINNDGFINELDLGEREINLLVMGSSHLESFQMSENECVAGYLNSFFGKNMYAYNIATSGHSLLRNCDNLENALSTYNPTDYVIIETPNVVINLDDMDAVNNGTATPLSSNDSEILNKLQKITYLRRVYHQYASLKKNNVAESGRVEQKISNRYLESLDMLLNNAAQTAEKYGVELIIVSHSPLALNTDATVADTTDSQYLEAMRQLCEKNNIVLLDMAQTFTDNYYENHVLPYGFSNTAVGVGHLNSDGQRMIAQRIYETVTEESK